MVHVVKIQAFAPAGTTAGWVAFELGGQSLHARLDAQGRQTEGLLEAGAEYPLDLSVECETAADYTTSEDVLLKVIEPREAGDRVEVQGRTWSCLGHDAVGLQSDPAVTLRLTPPQQATDFRGGSRLRAVGVLCAALPEEEH